jgi:hypothetical protein
MIWLLPAIFVIVNGDTARIYEGQSKETIQTLLVAEGKIGSIVPKDEYDVFIEVHKAVKPQPNPVVEQAKIDFMDKTKKTDERLDALIKVLGL